MRLVRVPYHVPRQLIVGQVTDKSFYKPLIVLVDVSALLVARTATSVSRPGATSAGKIEEDTTLANPPPTFGSIHVPLTVETPSLWATAPIVVTRALVVSSAGSVTPPVTRLTVDVDKDGP